MDPSANKKPGGEEGILELPLGLLGFEQTKRYRLLSRPEEAPFLWLEMLDCPSQAFLVVPPATFLPEYQLDLSDEDVAFLDLRDPDDALVMNIVTLRPQGPSTVNLKGPIVVNRRTRIAKQVIPLNAACYPLQHPLPATE